MGINLFKHNAEAYEHLVELYKNENRVAIIHPTGSGKSFIALKLMEDNKGKRAIYLSPSVEILHQLKRDIFNSGLNMSSFSGLSRMTYQKLINMSLSEIKNIEADIIVLDEFHHLGAPIWGEAVKKLLLANPEAKVLGLSATPLRYNDSFEVRDMAEEIFHNNVASEITLEEAFDSGILSAPKYITGFYEYEEIIKVLEEKIDKCQDVAKKQVAQKEMLVLKKMLQEAITSLPELFEKNMKNKAGKYIIYCRNIEDMYKKMASATELFGRVNSNIKIMHMASDENVDRNQSTIDEFESNVNENQLKLLFSVNMLNEGYHIKDLDGVIMMRPTHSPTLYTQQLGRALSAGKGRIPLVIDLVNNVDSIKIVETFFGNMSDKILNKDDTIASSNIFTITEQVRNIRSLVEKITALVSRNRMVSYEEKLEIMKRYLEVTQEKITRNTIFEGFLIGRWREDLNIQYINGKLNLSEELMEEYKKIGVLREPVIMSSFLKNAREIKQWMIERETTKPPAERSKDKDEKRLASALSSIRMRLIKPFLLLKTEKEKEEFKIKHPEIEEVMQIVDEIDSKNISPYLKNARAIKQWMNERKTVKPPAVKSKDEEESRLGIKLSTIRTCLINKYIKLKTEEEKEKFKRKHPELEEVMQIVSEIDENNISSYLQKAREIKQWMEKNKKAPYGGTSDIEEKKLSKDLLEIKKKLIKPYIILRTEEEKCKYRMQHPEIDEVMQIVQEADKVKLEMIREKRASIYLQRARNIRAWSEENGRAVPSVESVDEEEKRLGRQYHRLREKIIRPYLMIETEEEREKFKTKYPKIDEIMQELDIALSKKESTFLQKAQEIKQWMKERKTTKPPAERSKDMEERRLAKSFSYIRQSLIRPYIELESEQEKREYEKEHPELPEIVKIVNEIEINSKDLRKGKREKLAGLIVEYWEKRESLIQARALEKQYEDLLSSKDIDTEIKKGDSYEEE